MTEPLLCELSVSGRKGVQFPKPDVPKAALPANLTRRWMEDLFRLPGWQSPEG